MSFCHSVHAFHGIAFQRLPALQIGDTLEEFLVQATDDDGLRQVMMSMAEAIRTIAFKVYLNAALLCSHLYVIAS